MGTNTISLVLKSTPPSLPNTNSLAVKSVTSSKSIARVSRSVVSDVTAWALTSTRLSTNSGTKTSAPEAMVRLPAAIMLVQRE